MYILKYFYIFLHINEIIPRIKALVESMKLYTNSSLCSCINVLFISTNNIVFKIIDRLNGSKTETKYGI